MMKIHHIPGWNREKVRRPKISMRDETKPCGEERQRTMKELTSWTGNKWSEDKESRKKKVDKWM